MNHLRLFGILFLNFLSWGQIMCQQTESAIGPVSSKTGLLLKDPVVNQFIQVSSGDRALDYVSQIALWDRNSTEGYHIAAEWVERKAKEFNLQNVRIEKFPCDGKTEYFGQILNPEWKIKKAELWMTSPYSLKITSYDIAHHLYLWIAF